MRAQRQYACSVVCMVRLRATHRSRASASSVGPSERITHHPAFDSIDCQQDGDEDD